MQYLKQVNNRQWYSKVHSLCGLIIHSISYPCTSYPSPDKVVEEINGYFAVVTAYPLFSPAFSLPASLPHPHDSPLYMSMKLLK